MRARVQIHIYTIFVCSLYNNLWIEYMRSDDKQECQIHFCVDSGKFCKKFLFTFWLHFRVLLMSLNFVFFFSVLFGIFERFFFCASYPNTFWPNTHHATHTHTQKELKHIWNRQMLIRTAFGFNRNTSPSESGFILSSSISAKLKFQEECHRLRY